jgi:tRNA (cmo5U34)-methyltransferase
MKKFDESEWANSEFAQNYRDASEIFLPFRGQFIGTALSFFEQWISNHSQARVLDLGCGDGLFIQDLLESFAPAKVRLVDGSQDMLDAARERLGERGNINYTLASFQELLANDPLNEQYDFIYSSLAIHHLALEENKNLYAYIYNHLSAGGCFLHYDVVTPPSERLEECYMSMWRQWIKEHPGTESRRELMGIPEEYKGNQDNMPDTLESQLRALEAIGFKDVDCYFKYGIFSLFGGGK